MPPSPSGSIARRRPSDGACRAAFTAALETSCAKAFPGAEPAPRELSRYLKRCTSKISRWPVRVPSVSAAWDHFVLEMRPGLYRAADALDPSGGARELADSLYADLYGVDQRGGARQSLLRYFHGRSSLATWLRAVLAQRYVDRVRVGAGSSRCPKSWPAARLSTADPNVRDSSRSCARRSSTPSPSWRRAIGCGSASITRSS